MSIFRKLFGRWGSSETEEPAPDINIELQISHIEKKESEKDIEPGRKIHSFSYGLFEIRLDRDITKNYRITVFQGAERMYSFTVFAGKGEYEKLGKAYSLIQDFLKGDQSISNLPDSDLVKGFYFGNK